MATIMSDYAPTVVRRIDAGEVERLYFLAGRDREEFAAECIALFGLSGIDSARASFSVDDRGIVAYVPGSSPRSILRSDIYRY